MTRETILAAVCLSMLCGTAPAQDIAPAPATPTFRAVDISTDSGLITNDTGRAQVIYSEEVRVSKADWIRLEFGEVLLSGQPDTIDESLLIITSLGDGATQYLSARHVEEWQHTSAYFNGDAVRVEIFSAEGTGPNRVEILSAAAGDPDGLDQRSICGATDDRTLSDIARAGRYFPAGCTAWIIGDRCLLSAGHCVASGGVVQFNVPLSTGGGSPVSPPPEDQYSVDPSSMQYTNGGIGNDWSYFGCFDNSNTGLSVYEAQGDLYDLAASAPAVSGQTIRITGYGTTSSPVPNSWNLAQKTHTGPYTFRSGTTIQYAVDTTGGNSGSPVLDESTGLAIGIHTNAGCSSGGGANSGTAIHNAGLQNALANPRGVCRFIDCNNNTINDLDEIAADPAADCDNDDVLDECQIAADPSADCNNDGVLDSCQMVDCNNNGILDECDIASAFESDCNGNGQPDSCDLAPVAFAVTSPTLSPIGFADPHSYTVVGAPVAVTDVTLDFAAIGDFDAASERVTVFVGGTIVGFALEAASACSAVEDTDQMIVPAATWNAAVASGAGDATIQMSPSSQVNSTECFSGTHIRVAVSYGTDPISADDNGNGTPDECESLACSEADLTTQGAGSGDPGFGAPDGAVTAADLNYFVNGWVAQDLAVADLTTQGAGSGDPGFGTPDGAVTAADLNYYVNLWVAGCP